MTLYKSIFTPTRFLESKLLFSNCQCSRTLFQCSIRIFSERTSSAVLERSYSALFKYSRSVPLPQFQNALSVLYSNILGAYLFRSARTLLQCSIQTFSERTSFAVLERSYSALFEHSRSTPLPQFQNALVVLCLNILGAYHFRSPRTLLQ